MENIIIVNNSLHHQHLLMLIVHIHYHVQQFSHKIKWQAIIHKIDVIVVANIRMEPITTVIITADMGMEVQIVQVLILQTFILCHPKESIQSPSRHRACPPRHARPATG